MKEEKILGFRKRDAEFLLLGEDALACEHYRVGKGKLVPVNLKSESVTLEWLKRYCESHKQNGLKCYNRKGFPLADFVFIAGLLSAAKRKLKSKGVENKDDF